MPNGYDKPAPWIFKGKALYQLQLVPTEEARKHIPPEFKIVDFFGHTLGGVYLARYSDSPVGSFDELVVMGGLVWNPPTSCAWASRVYVSNKDARNHGLTHVGLPSRCASFVEAQDAAPSTPSSSSSVGVSWWGQKNRGPALVAGALSGSSRTIVIRNVEAGARGMRDPVCHMTLPEGRGEKDMGGPEIKISLPSFSGGTVDHPGFLKYACDLATRVRISPPIALSFPSTSAPSKESMVAVLSGKPLVTFAFDDFVMSVGAPVPITVEHPDEAKRRKAAEKKGAAGALAVVGSWPGAWSWPGQQK